MLGAGEHRAGLRARPLERLLDLGAGGVRELGRLVARLLEQAVALGLRLLQLGGRVGVGLREQLARLVPRGVQHLGALALALLAVALDLGLARLQVDLAAAHLLLGLAELGGRRVLRVALDRVGELGGGADEMERVHPDRVPGRLDGRRPAGRLEHAELRLQLGGMPAEGVEGLANVLRVEAVPARGDVLDISAGSSATGLLPGLGLRLPSGRASLSTRRRAARVSEV